MKALIEIDTVIVIGEASLLLFVLIRRGINCGYKLTS